MMAWDFWKGMTMLKVLSVVDKNESAIDRMAKGNGKYNDNLEYRVVDVHPKRPDPIQLENFERYAKDAQIIDWQYFRTAEMLRSRFDLKDKKHILTHHNPYSITENDWNSYDAVVANNEMIYEELGKITSAPLYLIPNCVDTDFWVFNKDWQQSNRILMVSSRIEAKKGIYEVSEACKQAGLEFHLVGSISDRNYFDKLDCIFHERITDEQLRDLYYSSAIHVCNSVDNFESGTNPILEAMLCGTPVLTRNIGHVPELNNKDNMVILNSQPEGIANIKKQLLDMLNAPQKLKAMRESAWGTAKNRSFERRAYMYQKLYREVLSSDKPVSIVVPIFDKPDIISKCLDAIANQTYSNIELLIVDDNYNNNYDLVAKYREKVNFPVRYINTSYSLDYGLARARNEGTIEATGEIMVYCDQRMIMAPDAVEEFIKHIVPKHWLYGNKGVKKEFVENFSCVGRQDVIDAGMFNERIYLYGGMSQELRARIRHQGFTTDFIESAKAVAAGKSSNKHNKRADIIKMKNRLYKMELQ